MYFLIRFLIRKWRARQARATGEEGGKDAAPSTEDNVAALASVPSRRGRVPRTGPSAASRGQLALLAHQVRYDVLASLRDTRARFMTFVFPLILLVVFTGVFGGGHTVVSGVRVKMSEFYVPGILAMSVVVASYASLVISITTLRETGVLKRRRATPVQPALLIAGQALSSVVIAGVMTALLLIVAKVFYGVGLAPAAIAATAITVLLATFVFACIAYAVSGMIGSPDAAQPIVQATMLPLWFISGVFIPDPNLSSTLRRIGDVFPVAHLSNSLHLASVHSSFTSALSDTDLLVLAAWGVGATALAVWRFRWLPSTAAA